MEAKGAVKSGSKNGKKIFSPFLRREDAALSETEAFLSRVYNGSISLMVSSLTKKQALTQEEVNELYALLKDMEANKDG